MSNPPVVNFVAEGGQPVHVVGECSPGVEVVQGFGADGARTVTAMPEGGPGIKPVFVTPGSLPLHLDPAAQAAQRAGEAYQAQLAAASSAAAVHAAVDRARATAAAFLLLL